MATQLNIFGEQITGLSISETAENLKVSTATVRNWVKTGLLTSIDGKISISSYHNLIEKNLGTNKLVSRANKLMKDEELISSYTINSNVIKDLNPEEWSEHYENSLSESIKNKEGIFYTPEWVIEEMLNYLDGELDHSTFCDPCCGTGNFLIAAIKKGVKVENLYGFDTDENSLEIARNRIKALTGIQPKNLVQADFLELSLKKGLPQFDLIFTNPPWGKKIPNKLKSAYSSHFGLGKCKDTSAFFISAALDLLSSKGKMGFLVQEAVFNIATYEPIRQKMLEFEIEGLVDFVKAFKKLQTGAQAIILKNSKATESSKTQCRFQSHSFLRKQSSFYRTPHHIFNFWASPKEVRVLDHLFSIPHASLKNNAEWALGIVTGNNKEFCKDKPLKNHVAIYKGKDISKNGLKEPTCFIPKDFSSYQQVAPLRMYQNPDKIIYRFISNTLCFAHEPTGKYILNSANLFIPSTDLPVTPSQLCDLLNSELMNWIFQKLFRTHKILRSDLESLPLHLDYFKTYKSFKESSYLDFLNLQKHTDGTYSIKE